MVILKSSFLLPMVQGILPEFLRLLLAAKSKGWGVFTTASLDNLVHRSNVVFRNFESVLGCFYIKVIHQTIEWWNIKIAWCLQHCTDALILAFAHRVSHRNSKDGATHFTALYFGETIQIFACWSARNYPRNMSWFGNRPTHIFKVNTPTAIGKEAPRMAPSKWTWSGTL